MVFGGTQAPLLGPGLHLTFPGWSLLPRTVFQSHSSSHCPGALLWSALGSAELKVPCPCPRLPSTPAFSGPHSSLRNELYHAGLVWSSGSFPSHMCDHGDDPGDGHTNSSRSYSRTRSLGGKPGFLVRLLPRTLLDQRPLEGTELFFSLFRFLLLHLL